MFLSALEENSHVIQRHLDAALVGRQEVPVVHAMRHALNGGKRLRAFLVVKSAALYDISLSQSVWPASGIEAIHAYSLVHDDMPCMDDDDLRRGLPTIHKKWDEATAVLAGDALQSLGFELVLNAATSPDAAIRCELALGLAKASGAEGMVLGQALDIAAETAEVPLTLEDITALQNGKRVPCSAGPPQVVRSWGAAIRNRFVFMRMRWDWHFKLPTTFLMLRGILKRRESGFTKMKLLEKQLLCHFWDLMVPKRAQNP